MTGTEQMNRDLERFLKDPRRQQVTMTVEQWAVVAEGWKDGWRAHKRAHRSKSRQRVRARA